MDDFGDTTSPLRLISYSKHSAPSTLARQRDVRARILRARRGIFPQPIYERIQLLRPILPHQADLYPVPLPEIIAVVAEQKARLVQLPPDMN